MNVEEYLKRLSDLEVKSPDAAPGEREQLEKELQTLRKDIEEADIKAVIRNSLRQRLDMLAARLKEPQEAPEAVPDKKEIEPEEPAPLPQGEETEPEAPSGSDKEKTEAEPVSTEEEVKTETAPAPEEEVKTEAAPAPEEEVRTEAAPEPEEEVKTEAAPAPEEEVKTEAAPEPEEETKAEAAPVPVEEEVKTEADSAEEPAKPEEPRPAAAEPEVPAVSQEPAVPQEPAPATGEAKTPEAAPARPETLPEKSGDGKEEKTGEPAEELKEPEAGKEKQPSLTPAECAAEIAQLETETDEIVTAVEELEVDKARPRGVFALRNGIKDLQNKLRELPFPRSARERIRLRLQQVWLSTQEFLDKYTELGKSELAGFHERADEIAKRAEATDSFKAVGEVRESIKEVQGDLRTAHLKREEFQKIRKRLQDIWDVVDKTWVRLREAAKDEVDAFAPRIEEVRELAKKALRPNELREAGDVLKAAQAELKGRIFPRSDKDRLFRSLQEVWEILQEKWRDIRGERAVSTVQFDDRIAEVQKAVDAADEDDGFKSAREAMKKLQSEIRAAGMQREDRNRFYDALQLSWEALMKKQEEWYKRGAR